MLQKINEEKVKITPQLKLGYSLVIFISVVLTVFL